MSGRRTRVLRALARALPRRDRVWGEALIAELHDVPNGKRVLWAMGLAPLLLDRAWRRVFIGDFGSFRRDRSTRDGIWLGLAVGAVIAAGLTYSNLGPSSRRPTSDPAWMTLIAYGLLASVFIMIGFFGRGRGRGMSDCARAALTCAVVLTAITFATSAVIDNVWLAVVARQPDKIYGLKHSALFHDMRMYVNGMNVIGLVIATPVGAAAGAMFGAIGALMRSQDGGRPRADRSTVT